MSIIILWTQSNRRSPFANRGFSVTIVIQHDAKINMGLNMVRVEAHSFFVFRSCLIVLTHTM